MNKRLRVTLSKRPNGFGYFCGEFSEGDQLHLVSVLPPANEWDGDHLPSKFGPDEKAWIIYIDGKEYARAKSREEVEGLLGGWPQSAVLWHWLRSWWR